MESFIIKDLSLVDPYWIRCLFHPSPGNPASGGRKWIRKNPTDQGFSRDYPSEHETELDRFIMGISI